jgi:Family of unknown function (DUF6011)
MDLSYKTAYAAQERAQEEAAYEAKMRRDDALLTAQPTWTVTTDTWALRIMREAKEVRDANPGQTPEERATDAHLDAYLAACEDAAAQHGTVTAHPVADAPAWDGKVRSSGMRASTYTANPASDAQLRFLTSLHRDLGTETPTPRDKAHASLLITQAKAALEKARRTGTAAPAAKRPATEGQLTYLADLLVTREHTYTAPEVAGWGFAEASAAITALRSAPRLAKAAPAAHGITEGRYAYQPEGAQAIFLRVSRTGRVYVQAGPAEHPYRGQDTDALRWIAANQRDAAALYGRLLGVCGMCGRELTDEESRARGLGPVCASK